LLPRSIRALLLKKSYASIQHYNCLMYMP